MPTTVDVTGSGARAHTGSATVAHYSSPANNDVANATTLTYTSADLVATPVTDAFSTIGATRETGEDVLGGTGASGGMSAGSIWYRIVNTSVPVGSVVTFSSTDKVGMDVFALPAGSPATIADFASMVPRGSTVDPGVVLDSTESAVLPNHGYTVTQAVGGAVLNWIVKASEQYYVRIHPLGFYTEPTDGHVTHNVHSPVLSLRLTKTALPVTPVGLSVSVFGGTPYSRVHFTVDGASLPEFDGHLDADGDLFGFVVQIPRLDAGSHMLLATDTVSGFTSADNGIFTVGSKFAYGDDPAPVSFSLPGTPTRGADGVLRFLLTDPTDSSTYSFEINPTSSSMVSNRTLTPGTTTSPIGTPIIWEGGKRGRVVTLTGDVLTLTQLNTLRSWCAKPYRIFMSDDIGRQYVVMLRSIKAAPTRSTNYPEHHSYVLTLLLLGRVSDLDVPDIGYPDPHLYPEETLYPSDL